MKKFTKAMPIGRQGFTLIELLIVIAIIGILSSVILVSLNSSKTKSKDSSAFAAIASSKATAISCMMDENLGATRRLSNPFTAAQDGSICCTKTSVSCDTPAPGYADWADWADSGWASGTTFNWCTVPAGVLDVAVPTPTCNAAMGTTCGYNPASGQFCYRFTNGTKLVWCSENGCIKSGF